MDAEDETVMKHFGQLPRLLIRTRRDLVPESCISRSNTTTTTTQIVVLYTGSETPSDVLRLL